MNPSFCETSQSSDCSGAPAASTLPILSPGRTGIPSGPESALSTAQLLASPSPRSKYRRSAALLSSSSTSLRGESIMDSFKASLHQHSSMTCNLHEDPYYIPKKASSSAIRWCLTKDQNAELVSFVRDKANFLRLRHDCREHATSTNMSAKHHCHATLAQVLQLHTRHQRQRTPSVCSLGSLEETSSMDSSSGSQSLLAPPNAKVGLLRGWNNE